MYDGKYHSQAGGYLAKNITISHNHHRLKLTAPLLVGQKISLSWYARKSG